MSSTTVPLSLHETSAVQRIYGAHPFHTDGDLLALAFAPDGTLWSVEDAGVLRHWNLASQRQLGWNHLEELATLWSFSPDGRYLAAGSDVVTIWEVASGETLTTFTWSRRPRWVTAIAFHPHLGLVATGHDDREQRNFRAGAAARDAEPVKFQAERRNHRRPNPGMVRVWDIQQDEPIHKFSAPLTAISAVAFSPDGKKLAAADEDRVIHLWDIQSGQPCGTFMGSGGRISVLAWHPGGKKLVSAGWETTIRVWDVETGEPAILLNYHKANVHTLTFNHDGTHLASADEANTIHIWDLERNQTVAALPPQANEIHCLAYSADGQVLVSGGGERVLHLWDARQQPNEDSMTDPLLSRTALAISADGKHLTSLGAGTSLRVWDTASGDSVLSLANAGVLRSFAASPDGAWIAASLADEDAPLETATLGLWDAATGKRHLLLEGQKPPITALAFAPDSTLLASSGYQSTDVWLWKIPAGEPALLIPNATDGCSVEALAWHPLGRLLACAGIDWLSTGGSDGCVILWEVSEHKQSASFPGAATALAFHPSGKKLAVATLKNTVRLWTMESEEAALELIGHFDAVTCLAYSPDGRILASGSHDHTIRLWDAETGDDRGLIELDTQIKALAFSPDGKYLYTGNGNTSCYQLEVRQIPSK